MGTLSLKCFSEVTNGTRSPKQTEKEKSLERVMSQCLILDEIKVAVIKSTCR